MDECGSGLFLPARRDVRTFSTKPFRNVPLKVNWGAQTVPGSHLTPSGSQTLGARGTGGRPRRATDGPDGLSGARRDDPRRGKGGNTSGCAALLPPITEASGALLRAGNDIWVCGVERQVGSLCE